MKLQDLKNFSEKKKNTLHFDYNIKNLNWFNIGGKSKLFYKPDSLKDLSEFLKIYNKRGKIFILGAGSNTLFTDEVYNGVVVKLGNRFNNISKLNDNTVIAGSNVLDKNLSNYLAENEIGGLEFLSCIPGTVGGGVKMNSGCYGKEFKDFILSIQVMDFEGNIYTIPSSKINFFYRGTDLKNDLIFLSASFKGKKKKKEQIYEEIERLKNKKKISQPSRVKTGGSTFKNPINSSKLKVWELIKNSVPAGCEFGDATISHQHFNFLVNKKDAKFSDMIKLITFIKKKVFEKYKIKLNLEIVIAD